jgi:hypothetical protein
METKSTDHSIVFLLRELRDETTTLVRQEIALAKAEICEKSSRLARNAVYIAAGALLAYTALILALLGFRDLLALALTKAELSPDVAGWLSALIIALVVAAAGAALIIKGKKALADESLVPTKTVGSLKENQHLIKQKLART